AGQDRAGGDDAAERSVAGAHLLGHVDAAATDREAHLEAGGGEVALALGKADRPERRQDRRCREQIRNLFGGLRRRGRAQQSKTERAAAGEEPAAGNFFFPCGHLTLPRRRLLPGALSGTIRPRFVLQYECTGKTRLPVV